MSDITRKLALLEYPRLAAFKATGASNRPIIRAFVLCLLFPTYCAPYFLFKMCRF